MSCVSSGNALKKSTASQRAVETREYDVNTKDLMQSTIGAFQDLGFTIDTLNEEFGLITASKIEETKNGKSIHSKAWRRWRWHLESYSSDIEGYYISQESNLYKIIGR